MGRILPNKRLLPMCPASTISQRSAEEGKERAQQPATSLP